MWCDSLGDIILKHCVVKVNEACGQKLFLSECVCVCVFTRLKAQSWHKMLL